MADAVVEEAAKPLGAPTGSDGIISAALWTRFVKKLAFREGVRDPTGAKIGL